MKSHLLAAAVFSLLWTGLAAPAQEWDVLPEPPPPPTPLDGGIPDAMAETVVPSSEPIPIPTQTPPPAPQPPPFSIEIDLEEQKAYLLKNGRMYASSPISSGRYGHLTSTGDFQISQKDLNHKSNLYGKIVDREGRTVIADADSSMSVPAGCRFVPAPMKYFMRFNGAQGMHAGRLPGYPASHGCVRMPPARAQLFYEHIKVGSPVHVFGKTPARKASSRVVANKAAPRPRAVIPPPRPVERSFFDRLLGRTRADSASIRETQGY